jgi:hypothetical protein
MPEAIPNPDPGPAHKSPCAWCGGTLPAPPAADSEADYGICPDCFDQLTGGTPSGTHTEAAPGRVPRA